MKSRMEKYYNNTKAYGRRVVRNENLYDKISNSELDQFKINPNASIIKEEVSDINIDELKNILTQKYKNGPKRKSIFLENEEIPEKSEEIITKEYDINAILAKAHEEKEDNYENDKYKKISNTQYDILKDLKIKEPVPEEESKDEDLMTLINTITAKELEKTGELDPLDILSDLKGSPDTVVIPPIKENEEQNEETINEKSESQEDKDTSLEEEKIDKSFYTTSSNFTQSDFDFIDELKDSAKEDRSVMAWILITISILAFLAGVVIILNKYFELGLF